MRSREIGDTGRPARRHGWRSGFTLVELLIVVAILLLIAVMTAYGVNLSMNNDKVRSGARQVQSYLEGARDRAIYAKSPRGVRFLLDPTNNRTVSSMVFIQQSDPWNQGTIQLGRLDADGDGFADSTATTVVYGFDNLSNGTFLPTGWQDLYGQGLLSDGARIQIPKDTGLWYTITTEMVANASPPGSGGPNAPRLHLTTPYADSLIYANATDLFPVNGPSTYLLELPPSVLPGAEAVIMPKGSVIHLDRSTTVKGNINNLEQVDAATPASLRGDKLPSAWKVASSADPSGFIYTTKMDVMFSPRGVVTGTAGQRGLIHLYVADQKDADRDRLYWSSPSSYPTSSAPEYGIWSDSSSNGFVRGDKVLVTLFTRTGTISTHSIFNSPDPTNPDPFKFAETGEVAGK